MDKRLASIRSIYFIILTLGFSFVVVAGSKFWQYDPWIQVSGTAAFALVSFGYLFWRGNRHRAALPRTSLEWGIIAVYAALVMTWIISIDQREGLERVVLLMTYGVIFYLLVDAFEIGLDRSLFFAAMLTVTGMLLLFALLETSNAYRSWWVQVDSLTIPPHPYRFVGLLGHPNALMALANLAAPLAVATFFRTTKRLVRVAVALWIVMFVAALFFSSSRGAFLGVLVWSSFMFIIWLVAEHSERVLPKPHRSQPSRLVIGAAAVLVLVAIVLILVTFLSRHPSHGATPFGSREPIWRTSFQIWLDQPLVGAGPGRFPLAYLDANPDIPPDFWSTHAHNIFLQVMAESGIIGLLSLVWLIGFAVRIFLPRLRSLSRHPEQLAVVAALLGFFAQSMVDEFSQWVAVMIPMLALAAWLFSKPGENLERYPSVRMSILFVPLASILFVILFRLWAYFPAASAIRLALIGEHHQAGQKLALSASRDPNIAFYPGQAGMHYAESWMRTRDPLDLELARSFLRRSAQMEPGFSWLWANIAALDWLSYDLEAARIDIQAAIQRAPRSATFRLNAGWYAEQLDDRDAAQENYSLALELKPEWASHPFWNLTPLRQEFIRHWRDSHPQVNRPVYWYAAELAVASGASLEAQQLLAYAAWLGEPSVCIERVRAGVYELQGDLPAAERSYVNMIALLDTRELDSGNPLAETLAIWVYQRLGVSHDLVPGVLNLSADCGQFDAAERYAATLRANGRCDDAAAVWTTYQQALRGGSREFIPLPPECQEQ